MIESAIYAVILAINSLSFPSYAIIPLNALLRAINIITKPTGYEDEKFSDAFATSYGYGHELNLFLDKIR